MTVSQTPVLFQPLRVGDIEVKHRVVLAPLTRVRAHADHVPGPQAATYYSQRSSMPGTLLISEATVIAPQAGGTPHAPGIWSDAQIAAWKEITEAVHAKGSYIYLQLWAMGRAGSAQALKADGHELVSASAIPYTDLYGTTSTPRPLAVSEVQEYVQLHAKAAENAIAAGFDGVEVHGANGYLVDQFLQDVSNTRTDEYGGSVENRARFALEVVDAIVKAIGASRTAIRLSPWGKFQAMGMEDPVPTYTYLTTELAERNIAYIHVIEPRADELNPSAGLNDFIRKIWGDRAYITAGGNTRDIALQEAEEKGGLFAFGRLFISNPDLPRRLRDNILLTAPDRSKFYLMGNLTPEGYTDWPFA
ncbi:FMN-linked oxidoreductase [Coniophora puteana RWD-64-598 SS2]|uniref:FMN-linked oxidoreductase n=1 Tax=Coniophora puteana (strain RWD-64-598) TaxID=741705 RepID=A0A5M3M948_CONPW|nr:FMN-linked oxidoreductase [Coniophora puteana RWD-64-598 SS2]EIW75739.1 FMN-linked oxidoreductase [Coniophora puteana RWD-64-598 SS2]